MRNISTEGQDIKLIRDKYYYIIDALYLNSIKSEILNLSNSLIDKEIERIFPYTDAPFAKITNVDFFKVRNIVKAKYNEINSNDKNYISVDSGLIIFIAEEILFDFLKVYDYDRLIESITENTILEYWEQITYKFDLNNLGLILAPGVGSGYEFEGSGIYKINLQ